MNDRLSSPASSAAAPGRGEGGADRRRAAGEA